MNPTDKAKAVIEKLGGLKKSYCGVCGTFLSTIVKKCDCGQLEAEYKPILIGDVLEWITDSEEGFTAPMLGVVCMKWWKCSFTRSLQEIAEPVTYRPLGGGRGKIKSQLTPEATALFDFLYELTQ